MRSPGIKLHKLALFGWAVVITAVLLLLSLPVLAGRLIYRYTINHRMTSPISLSLINQPKTITFDDIPSELKDIIIGLGLGLGLKHNYCSGTNLFNPWFVTGFIDGEGSFMIQLYKSPAYRLGWSVEPQFTICLSQKDRFILEHIKSYLGVGNICNQGSNAVRYQVKSIKEFLVVITHFDNYPLITQKLADYIIWKKIILMMEQKEHLTLEGLEKIVALKASLNLGLSDQLKEAFSGVVPVAIPRIAASQQIIQDPQWVAGFTSAEGCFFIDIYKSKTKSGVAVKLVFYLAQHCRDKELMKGLIEYFECGNIHLKKEKVNFAVQKYSNLTDKIIPFFKKYPVIGEKSKDFADFCKVAELMKTKTHLTQEGLDQIRLIKVGMNRSR